MENQSFQKKSILKNAAESANNPNTLQMNKSIRPTFPNNFLWGVATSSYQVEGAANDDDKGKSIWDIYTHLPGKVVDGSNGDIAIDHYHLYKQDIQLMKEMGVKAYRFSISWPRIFPSGKGAFNPKGLDFYNRLTDELLKADIEPFATLYHWDLPQALMDDYGGWQSRETAYAFAEYAGFMANKLSDRVKNFFTMNEFYSFVDMGYQGISIDIGGKNANIELAPGLKLSDAELNQVRHHAVLAQGLSVKAIHANGKAGTKCGPADNINTAVPLIATPENIKAAAIATRELNAGYLTVMLEGKYTDAYLAKAGKDAPQFTEQDLKDIATPVDFIGLNVYRPTIYVEHSDDSIGYKEIPLNPSHPKMYSAWHSLGPEVMYWAPKIVQSLWNPKEIYITENGCAANDSITPKDEIYDTDRIMFLRANLLELQQAINEGVPLKGYFLWSFMDNFEWSAGYGNRFGLVHVDFKTLKRTPKRSAAFFKELSKNNWIP